MMWDSQVQAGNFITVYSTRFLYLRARSSEDFSHRRRLW